MVLSCSSPHPAYPSRNLCEAEMPSFQAKRCVRRSAAAMYLPFSHAKQPEAMAGASAATLTLSAAEIQVPRYLLTHYWWAYVHPNAVKVFERQWLVNLILWGNYERLRWLRIREIATVPSGPGVIWAMTVWSRGQRLSARSDNILANLRFLACPQAHARKAAWCRSSSSSVEGHA
jgi:hypothetical protein